jgi:hypothetical protein
MPDLKHSPLFSTLLIVFSFALACGPIEQSGPVDGDTSVIDAGVHPASDAGSDDVAACLAADTPCNPASRQDKPCCGELTCRSDASGLNACRARECADDGDCDAGMFCSDGGCAVVEESCAGLGEVCQMGACCTGSFCSTETLFAYGEGTCVGPAPLGSVCANDVHCASGTCADYVCAPAHEPVHCGSSADCNGAFCVDWICQDTCIDVGQHCQTDGCCEGAFCTVDILFSYAGGTCSHPLADGSQCGDDAHCASGACVDFVCEAQACVVEGNACAIWFEEDENGSDGCCSGLVCLDGGYLIGSCAAPLPAGAFCWRDVECASGTCGAESMLCE